jgi:hypothetical protein
VRHQLTAGAFWILIVVAVSALDRNLAVRRQHSRSAAS